VVELVVADSNVGTSSLLESVKYAVTSPDKLPVKLVKLKVLSPDESGSVPPAIVTKVVLGRHGTFVKPEHGSPPSPSTKPKSVTEELKSSVTELIEVEGDGVTRAKLNK
jgi:hypothetical protein